jgi:hypothetical protein
VDAAGMKTVYVNRDYYYTPHRKFSVAFKKGITYAQVLDKAAEAIERDGAGRVVTSLCVDAVDASVVWKQFGARIKNGRRR